MDSLSWDNGVGAEGYVVTDTLSKPTDGKRKAQYSKAHIRGQVAKCLKVVQWRNGENTHMIVIGSLRTAFKL